MGWIQDLVKPKTRRWEEFYRNRWQHDNVVRSTHGVNCTGGCSWNVFVKDGIVTWEMQALDYPLLEPGLPPYEPRGCQRGISASWYVYSPIRVKYPYIRCALADLWREARKTLGPVDAWAEIQSDPVKRTRIQTARGKGGFRRTSWEEALEIVSAACLSTARRWGPDRVFGFSPIPAMSYLSYAAGSRFLQLFGGVNMSFYDWYADLPNAFPEIWGDQTDVCESADWYNAKYIVSMGSNLNMTRTPDVHFISEARHEGAKFVVLSPDFSQVAKYADWWIPVEAGQDTALWMAVNHVILTEFHAERQVPYFVDYLKRTTDCPFLVELHESPEGLVPGQFLRAGRVARYAEVEHGEWKMLMWDAAAGAPRMPKGTVGFRWAAEENEQGKWNLKLEDGLDDAPIDPALSFLDAPGAEVAQVAFHEFATHTTSLRGVPVRRIETADGGTATVATVYDLLFAQFGVGRGLPGDYAEGYDDPRPYTPAWQEQYTKIGRNTVTRLAREFASTAEATNGKSMVIIGASINHWYNNNLSYRAPIYALILCGCCGVNGGGMNHYVGQEKLTLVAPWTSLAFALDWQRPPRQQQSPTWHYVNSDQWRYEGDFTDYAPIPPETKWAKGHAMDLEAMAVRMGWMPYYPQFDRNPIDLAHEAEAAGAGTADEIASWMRDRIVAGDVGLAVDDPDAPESWPRVWVIWRGNAISSSAKGHEFFLRYYLGTHDNVVAEEQAKGKVETVVFREPAPRGKMDLVVDINFRMDTSALYSDIVLPTASWYEKNDLNTTDLHSYVHPLQAAVPPVWESKTDWEIFKAIAAKVSELAPSAFPGPVRDVVWSPLAHDTADEIAQPAVLDWRLDECGAVPGKTMPHLRVVERDYAAIHRKFVSLSRGIRENGLAAHGMAFPVADAYDALLENPVGGSPDTRHMRCVEWEGERYPSLEDALDAANTILALAPETNGEIAWQAFHAEEKKTGLVLTDLADGNRKVTMTFGDLAAQPRRTLTSPCRSGLVNDGRAYAAWCLNVERLVPWRTLGGRQHFYIDHPYYLDFGEHLPMYKPKLDPRLTGDIVNSPTGEDTLVLNYITPHGKWHIHSTYGDTHRMMTLSRGIEPCWINDKDAARAGIHDNDWVEVYNDNGVMVTRAAVSSRVQPGTCMIYHAPERTLTMPKSQVRGSRRGGAHNSLTRTRINPVELAGGYAQFTYGFNYWGPIGVFTRDTYAVVKNARAARVVTAARKEATGMDIRAQVSMVFHLDKCIGCHTCSIACKNIWTDRKGAEYMWWNNVETKPGTGFPTLWEDQERYRGGWKRNGDGRSVSLRLQGKASTLGNIFANPSLPTVDDYYEPWTYDYEHLFDAPEGDDQPTARTVSMITGKPMDVEAGPNWDDDLGGSPVYAANDPNLEGLTDGEREQLNELQRMVFFYLPRICNHCVNPSCVAACPAGALYKRGEDGIVLLSQDKCRAWRMCVSGCPYKKTYYNWASGKSEKCILCFPHLESGHAPACFHSCVGRIRYLGVILYDAAQLERAAAVPDEQLVEAQRDMIADPHDPEVVAAARASGVSDALIEAARNSPVYRFVKEWRLALPLHAEFRTLPMLFYVPPMLPVIARVERGNYEVDGASEASAVPSLSNLDQSRAPIRYMASLFAAGNEDIVAAVYRKLFAVRVVMRAKKVGNVPAEEVEAALAAGGTTVEEAEAIFRLTSMPTFQERFVLPPLAREQEIEATVNTEWHKREAGFGFRTPGTRRW